MNEIKQLLYNTDTSNASSNLADLEALLYQHWHESIGLKSDDYADRILDMYHTCSSNLPIKDILKELDSTITRLELESTLFYSGVRT